MKNQLSIIVICGNESDVIANCLKTCRFADQLILVVTHTTTDQTIKIAQQTAPKIIICHADKEIVDFSYWRNAGAKLVSSGWILYVDADERVSPQLRAEILTVIKSEIFTNYDIPRENYFLGHRVRYGGTYPDYVKRLFLKSEFKGYKNPLHEQPIISGKASILSSALTHLTHRDLSTMLIKSLRWTKIESQMLYDSGHPPVVWWRFPRMMLTKLWERLVIQQMWRDGSIGWISAIFESFDTFIIYARLWELQQQT